LPSESSKGLLRYGCNSNHAGGDCI
jgi:hypothetical protein